MDNDYIEDLYDILMDDSLNGENEVQVIDIFGMEPMQALETGKELVRTFILDEGLMHLNYALDCILAYITGSDKDPPVLYKLADECYQYLITGSISFDPAFNLMITGEKIDFDKRFNVDKRVKGVEYPAGLNRLEDLFNGQGKNRFYNKNN